MAKAKQNGSKSHFIEVGKLWVNPEDGSISGCISLGPLGEVPFIARKSSYGGPDGQHNMIVAADKTPFGMIKVIIDSMTQPSPFKKKQLNRPSESESVPEVPF